MVKQPLVTVIIPNYNGEKFIERTLESVLNNTQIPFEVIVVDNASTDRSQAILENKFGQEKKLKVIYLNKNVGASAAIDIGAYKSRGKYVVILGYDMTVDSGWLREAVEFLDNNDEIGAGQLKILRMDRKKIYDSAGEKLTSFGFLAERAQGAKDSGQFDYVEDIFSGKGTAMIIRKNVYKEVGGFDPDYFMYWEEPDLCWRVWKAGYKVVFLPMGCTWHAYGTKEKTISKSWAARIAYFGCRNHITTITKNGVGLAGLRMLMAVVLAWTGLFFLFVAKLDLKKAAAVFWAFVFLVRNVKMLLKKRAKLKKRFGKKFYSDSKWFPFIEDKRGVHWYLGKAWAYITGKSF